MLSNISNTSLDQLFSTSTPKIMGILNVTPDSFSDGGKFLEPDRALERVGEMLSKGMDILDVGAESTRPGATAVSVNEEKDRLVPVIQAIKKEFDVPISVDTRKVEVMQCLLPMGIDMVNDVNALQDDGALAICATHAAWVCLMHMQGQPETMQVAPSYSNDVVQTVEEFLSQRLKACEHAGISRSKIILDPGFGFGKTAEHNWTLLACLKQLKTFDCPILVGLSRKSMLKNLLGVETSQLKNASVAAAMIALQNGAQVLRVHDVAATQQAVQIFNQVSRYYKK